MSLDEFTCPCCGITLVKCDLCKRDMGITRSMAIGSYHKWLQKKWVENGIVKQELLRLAKLYKETDELTLICLCYPKACHANVIANAIENIIKKGLV